MTTKANEKQIDKILEEVLARLGSTIATILEEKKVEARTAKEKKPKEKAKLSVDKTEANHIKLRKRIVKVMRYYARIYQLEHRTAWTSMYDLFREHTGFDAFKTGYSQGILPLDAIQNEGLLEKFLSFAVEIDN